MRRCDVIVVGAGAMGSAAAWWLVRRDRDVVVLERFEQGHVRGGSHGSSRIFRLAHPDPADVRMAQEALELWRELEAIEGADLLDVTGGVDHGLPSEVEAVSSALASCGVPFETLTAEEAAERFTGMRFDRRVVFQPEAGRANADATVAALHTGAKRMGAELRFEEGATTIEPRDDTVVVTTSQDTYVAPIAVVACGAWTPSLLDLRLPVVAVTQEQPAYFRPIAAGSKWPIFIHHAPIEVYGLDTPGIGVKIGQHATGAAIHPDRRSFEPDPTLLARLRAHVETWFPGLDPEPVRVDSCLYDTTRGEMFVIDRSGLLVVATGFSGRGFKFVPLVGRMLAGLALGELHPETRFRVGPSNR